jgi:hypothetical protein
MDRVARLPGARSVAALLHVPAGDGAAEIARAADRLTALYGAVLPAGGTRTRWSETARAGLVVLDPVVTDEPLAATVVWGRPVAASGDADDPTIRAALADPGRARLLRGTYALLSLSGQRARLVTGAALTSGLCTATGARSTAWATRRLAALALVGGRPVLDAESVVDQITFDYVLGDDELWQGVRTVDEAAVIDVGGTSPAVSTSWWPVAERVAPGPPTTAAGLRAELADAVVPLATAHGTRLGLTSGRDSMLVASVLEEHQVPVVAFTLGWRGLEDVGGAAAVARRRGWSHELARVARPEELRPDFEEMVRWTAWSEGGDGRSALLDPIDWEATDVTWLSGHGGEIGRAYYWGRADPARLDDPVELLAGPRDGLLGPERRDRLRARLTAELGAASELGRAGPGALDVLYARGRMRKWAGRVFPFGQLAHVQCAFTEPGVVRALLDVPLELRRTAAVFDHALAMGQDPRAQARRAARGSLPVRALRRARAAAGARHGRPRADWPILEPLVRRVGPGSLVRSVIGDRWWRTAVDAAPLSLPYQVKLWNALSIEAAAVWSEERRW